MPPLVVLMGSLWDFLFPNVTGGNLPASTTENSWPIPQMIVLDSVLLSPGYAHTSTHTRMHARMHAHARMGAHRFFF